LGVIFSCESEPMNRVTITLLLLLVTNWKNYSEWQEQLSLKLFLHWFCLCCKTLPGYGNSALNRK
ncbi:hypothetical protein J4Q44_G00313680, partial [Coregonus suidteri]